LSTGCVLVAWSHPRARSRLPVERPRRGSSASPTSWPWRRTLG
jgi:hypothetical protein